MFLEQVVEAGHCRLIRHRLATKSLPSRRRGVKGQPRIFANKDDVPSHETGEELTENDLQASDWYIVESV
jgi:hypothetical protein